MKQLTVQVKTPAGYDCGIKNIMSAHWNSQGELELLVVDFIMMERETHSSRSVDGR